ncbi:hypothetical protein TNCV_4883651 [Trichonephila clavipes]|nr:hypothetical protein TNCV_4883651 [Trichonephila clavipes]
MSTKFAWKLNTGVSCQTDHLTETSAHAQQRLRSLEKYHSVEFSAKRELTSAEDPLDACLRDTVVIMFPQQRIKLIQHDSVFFAALRETVKGRSFAQKLLFGDAPGETLAKSITAKPVLHAGKEGLPNGPRPDGRGREGERERKKPTAPMPMRIVPSTFSCSICRSQGKQYQLLCRRVFLLYLFFPCSLTAPSCSSEVSGSIRLPY